MKITVFVDESGSIPKSDCANEDYFIISLLFVDNIEFVKKVYKKERLKVIKKNPRLATLLKETKEIKGSEISETVKLPIYNALIKKCKDNFEIGLIVLDVRKCESRFRNNSSRAFNYLIKRYLESYFVKYSKFKNFDTIDFIIDERNVATGAKFLLEEYLNIELNLINTFCKQDITVRYYNSNKYYLLQLSDFIANSYYRNYKKHNEESKINSQILSQVLCNSKEYRFPL